MEYTAIQIYWHIHIFFSKMIYAGVQKNCDMVLKNYYSEFKKNGIEPVVSALLSSKRSVVKSSHRRCSVKKGVLRNFAVRKESLAQVFSCEFYEISKSTFSTKHLHTTVFASHKLEKFLKLFFLRERIG